MKKIIGLAAIVFSIGTATFAQEKNEMNDKVNVPSAVRTALAKKYPEDVFKRNFTFPLLSLCA